MKEGKIGVKRLLRSIEDNITDEGKLQRLSYLLNYDLRQLEEDIESISEVKILNKDEKPQT